VIWLFYSVGGAGICSVMAEASLYDCLGGLMNKQFAVGGGFAAWIVFFQVHLEIAPLIRLFAANVSSPSLLGGQSNA
jgi:hypothetical protein